MNIIKKLLVLTIVLCLSLLLAACMGAVQIEEYGYVQSFGIDKGENKKYSYSFLLQYYAAAGEDGGSSGEGNQGIIIGAEGDTIFEAISVATAGLPYELNFSRTALVFFSEELAKEGGIEQLFSLSFSTMKLRDSIKLMIVKCDPRVFQEGLQVKNSPDLLQMQRSIIYSNRLEGIVPMANYAMICEAVMTQRYDPTVQYGGIDMNILQSGSSQSGGQSGGGQSGGSQGGGGSGGSQSGEGTINGVKRFGGMAAYAEGAALFDGAKMVGTLNGEETKYMLMARGDLGKTHISYARENGEMLSVHLSQGKEPKVKLELDDKPRVHIDVSLACEIYMDTYDEATREWDNGLRQELETHIQNAIRGVFITCRDLGCDSFELGKVASMSFRDLKSWEEYDWKSKYPVTEATVKVNLILRDSYVRTKAE